MTSKVIDLIVLLLLHVLFKMHRSQWCWQEQHIAGALYIVSKYATGALNIASEMSDRSIVTENSTRRETSSVPDETSTVTKWFWPRKTRHSMFLAQPQPLEVQVINLSYQTVL